MHQKIKAVRQAAVIYMENPTQFKNSIALRYLAVTASVLVIGQLIFAVFVVYSNFVQQRDDLQQKAVSQARFLSAVSPDNVLANNFYPLETLMRQTATEPDYIYSLVLHLDGRALTNYLNNTDPFVLDAVANAAGSDIISRVDYISRQDAIIEVRSPIISEGLLIGYVRLGYSTDSLYKRLYSTLATTLLSSGLLTIMLAISTLVLFNLQIGKPLLELGRLTSQLASGMLDRRSPVQKNNEIGRLQNAFNEMASQLQDNVLELNKLSQVASRTNNAVVICDPEGRVEWVNDAFTRITGYTLAEVLGSPPGHILQGEKSDQSTIQYMKERLAQGEGFEVEIINYAKSGAPYWIAIEVRPVRNEQGELVNYIGIETDITERKRREADLRRYAEEMAAANRELFAQERRLRALLGVASESVAPTVQLQNVVEAGVELFDMNAGFIGRLQGSGDQMQIIAAHGLPQDLPSAMQISVKDTLCQLTFETADVVTQLGNNDPKPCFKKIDTRGYTGIRIDVQGKPFGVLGFMATDPLIGELSGSDQNFLRLMAQWVSVTIERLQARDELSAYARELERSNRELQDFAYVSSHDLQEPLRKIQAFGSRVESRYQDVLDERGVDYLRRISSSANRMQNLINDLLAFSRVTTKAQRFRPVDLNDLLQGVLSDLELRIEQTGALVEIAALPPIEGEPFQIRQLFQNIIGNGLKFIHPDRTPHIEIEGRICTIGKVEMVEISIKDNGIGFEMDHADKIFTIFQRLHGKLDYEGTGIGLAICRRITEHHRGYISAESQPDVGTTFTIQLPLRQEEKREMAVAGGINLGGDVIHDKGE